MVANINNYMKFSVILVSIVFASATQVAQNTGNINAGETVSDIVLDAGNTQAVYGTAHNSTINTGGGRKRR